MRLKNLISGLIIIIFLTVGANMKAQEHRLSSPDGNTEVIVRIGRNITYSVMHNSKMLIADSPISMTLQDKQILGRLPEILKVKKVTINEKIIPAVKQKSSEIIDNCNEMTINFKDNYGLVFRVYNDGVAYRFRTTFNEEITVVSEEATFNFTGDHNIYFPEEESFHTHQERLYKYISISEITPDRFSSIPVLVDITGGPKVLVTESDLEDYAGMYITGSGENSTMLVGKFPHFVLETEAKNDRDIYATGRADYIAKTDGKRNFPWRVIIIADEDGDLIENQMVYKLAKPLQLNDVSWIKPGKVTWDWWNAWNIYGVDFKAGINTETYKYYIDFASQYEIEYVILDEGWYKLGDLFDLNPDVDMEELTVYAEQKNVGLILWVIWKTLDNQLHEALDRFEKWGIKGIKVDFMQRDDQEVVNYYWKIAEEAAKRKLLVDFHGSYKPSGLRRAYPNVITREGVRGMEHSKWGNDASPENAVTLPFTRMVAGPLDYTPGAMINASKENFRPIYNQPMSQGTRCQQLAMYVVFESPLQMLADNPSNYLREKECMAFLAKVPTVWDETKVLDAKVAGYVLLARRNGDDWYVGAMTDWTPRILTIDFSFLGSGEYTIDFYQDGLNADRHGSDYKKLTKQISSGDRMRIKLAPGGGWAARIYKK